MSLRVGSLTSWELGPRPAILRLRVPEPDMERDRPSMWKRVPLLRLMVEDSVKVNVEAGRVNLNRYG